jgi:HPt (histidine-containing phosphotransfer) domain-containing protein
LPRQGDFAEKILAKFKDQSVQYLEALTKAVGEKHQSDAERAAHTMKGMAATVGRRAAARRGRGNRTAGR